MQAAHALVCTPLQMGDAVVTGETAGAVTTYVFVKALYDVGSAETTTEIARVAALHLALRCTRMQAVVHPSVSKAVRAEFEYTTVAGLIGCLPTLAGLPPSADDIACLLSIASIAEVDEKDVERMATRFFRVLLNAKAAPVEGIEALLVLVCGLCHPPNAYVLLECMRRKREEFAKIGPSAAMLHSMIRGAS
jgi:hypothetical protein